MKRIMQLSLKMFSYKLLCRLQYCIREKEKNILMTIILYEN